MLILNDRQRHTNIITTGNNNPHLSSFSEISVDYGVAQRLRHCNVEPHVKTCSTTPNTPGAAAITSIYFDILIKKLSTLKIPTNTEK